MYFLKYQISYCFYFSQDKSNDQPDLSIVKIETATERDMSNLEMYMGDEVFGHGHHSIRSEEDDPGPNYNVEEPPGEWPREETSNESSNISGMDGSSNWYMGQMKGRGHGVLSLVWNAQRSLFKTESVVQTLNDVLL